MDKPKISVPFYKVPAASPIDHDQLNATHEHTAASITTLADYLDKIIDIINSAKGLPDGSVSVEDGALDGANIFVDANAQDGDVFFDTTLPDGSGGTGRPVSIKEALYAIYKISAAATKHVREGQAVGSFDNPVSVASGASITVPWPYTDAIFVPYLFVNSSGTVTPATGFSYSLDTSGNTLIITNNSGADASVYGIIWHPAFAI